MKTSKVTRSRAAAIVDLYRDYAKRKITRRQYEKAVKTLWDEKKGA
jgi:hypothetical protein